jgi:hypothetical protein
MRLPRLVLLLLVAGVACRRSPSTVPDSNCGFDTTDWCPAPAGDPCGKHKDVASCRADPRCGGIAYRGESFAACQLDDRGFGTNCPTVGCISLAR